jgi:putative FmdB family regulatory protein
MPTYDYECANCGHTFETFQLMSAAPLKKCPQCERMRLKRLLGTGAGIIFKGSGFYQTDYKGGDKSGGASDSGKSAESTKSKDSSGADSGSSKAKADSGKKSSDSSGGKSASKD